MLKNLLSRGLLVILCLLCSLTGAEAYTTTTNYTFELPQVNNAIDQDLWGTELNSNWTSIDSLLLTATKTLHSTLTTTTSIDSTYRNKIILCDATGGNVTLNLAAAATLGDGFVLTIKKIDSSGNTCIIDPNSTETVDGATTKTITLQYGSAMIIDDGTNWQTVTSFGTSGGATVTSVAGRTGDVTIALADVTDWPGFGTTGSKAVQLSGGKLPAIDGSLLTGINPTGGNIPVVTNSNSGNIVIGAVTIQWGTGTCNGSGNATVTFGTAFSAPAYSMTTAGAPITGYSVGVSALGNTTATVICGTAFESLKSSGSFYWQAIGPT